MNCANLYTEFTALRVAAMRNCFFCKLLIASLFFGITFISIPEYTLGQIVRDRPFTPIPTELFGLSSSHDMSWARLREVLDIVGKEYYRRVSAEELVSKMISGGLISLDPHSDIMSQDEFTKIEMLHQGEKFGGLGIEIQKHENGGILVVAPIDDTPASNAGIKAQDIIVEINGQSTRTMTVNAAVKLLRGKPGTSVTFKILRKDVPEPLSFTLTRVIIQTSNVKHELKEGNIGVIRLALFGELVLRDMEAAIAKLKMETNGNLSGVVLDLRNNPGGLLTVADQIYDLFLDAKRYYPAPEGRMLKCLESTVTISMESRGKINPEKFCVGPTRDSIDGLPLVVLVNEGSASASEIVAGVLQKYGRAVVAGTSKSFGKGTVQTIRPLQTGGALRLTTSQYLIGPEGCEQVIQNKGVIPDIFIQDPNEKGFTGSERRGEASFPDAIASSAISDSNCKYHYNLPEGHLSAARNMLQRLGFTIFEKDPFEDIR